LKGADAAIAPVVVAAAERAGCDVHLALITIEESGSAQYHGDYRRRGRYRDDDEDEEDDEFEVVEVSESNALASHWRRPDGEPSPLTDIPVMEGEFSPPLSFEELEPDEQHFHEATGNEGASFERTYRRAALILWPRERLLAVINQAGLGVTLPFLEHLVDRSSAGGDGAMRDQAQALLREILSAWPRGGRFPHGNDERSDAGRFLSLLVRMNDEAKLQAFLDVLAGRHGFNAGDCADIADALHALPPDRAADLARRLIEGAAENTLAACATLLERISARDLAVAISAGRSLVASLPGDLPPAATDFRWRRGPGVRPGFIVDLFTALGRIDATLAAVAADHVLDWPKRYDFDIILVPAVGVLLDTPETSGQAAVRRLRAACLAHLEARIALQLEPPDDWRRDSRIGCTCNDCQALGLFLDDAAQPAWVFAAAEPRRRHVEETIRAAGCDVDTTTEKRGSPHRLICTKNQASYQRRCAQRANDLTERDRLSRW
jgi:hypothetical protein